MSKNSISKFYKKLSRKARSGFNVCIFYFIVFCLRSNLCVFRRTVDSRCAISFSALTRNLNFRSEVWILKKDDTLAACNQRWICVSMDVEGFIGKAALITVQCLKYHFNVKLQISFKSNFIYIKKNNNLIDHQMAHFQIANTNETAYFRHINADKKPLTKKSILASLPLLSLPIPPFIQFAVSDPLSIQFSIIEHFNFPGSANWVISPLRWIFWFYIFTQFSATSASANWFVFALFRFVLADAAPIEYLIKKYETIRTPPVISFRS